MPSQGYATIGLKPAILSNIQKITDKYYPGMFVPSTLIILMNEIKRGAYTVDACITKQDFNGRYTSLTIRSDVKAWLDDNYENYKEEYARKYKVNNFTQFASYFMLNIFESKAKSENYILKLKEADFAWLGAEYQKRKQEYRTEHSVYTFEQFADVFLKDLLDKVNEAKKILTV